MRLVQTVILSYFLELLENGIIFSQRKRPDLKDIEVLLELSSRNYTSRSSLLGGEDGPLNPYTINLFASSLYVCMYVNHQACFNASPSLF